LLVKDGIVKLGNCENAIKLKELMSTNLTYTMQVYAQRYTKTNLSHKVYISTPELKDVKKLNLETVTQDYIKDKVKLLNTAFNFSVTQEIKTYERKQNKKISEDLIHYQNNLYCIEESKKLLDSNKKKIVLAAYPTFGSVGIKLNILKRMIASDVLIVVIVCKENYRHIEQVVYLQSEITNLCFLKSCYEERVKILETFNSQVVSLNLQNIVSTIIKMQDQCIENMNGRIFSWFIHQSRVSLIEGKLNNYLNLTHEFTVIKLKKEHKDTHIYSGPNIMCENTTFIPNNLWYSSVLIEYGKVFKNLSELSFTMKMFDDFKHEKTILINFGGAVPCEETHLLNTIQHLSLFYNIILNCTAMTNFMIEKTVGANYVEKNIMINNSLLFVYNIDFCDILHKIDILYCSIGNGIVKHYLNSQIPIMAILTGKNDQVRVYTALKLIMGEKLQNYNTIKHLSLEEIKTAFDVLLDKKDVYKNLQLQPTNVMKTLKYFYNIEGDFGRKTIKNYKAHVSETCIDKYVTIKKKKINNEVFKSCNYFYKEVDILQIRDLNSKIIYSYEGGETLIINNYINEIVMHRIESTTCYYVQLLPGNTNMNEIFEHCEKIDIIRFTKSFILNKIITHSVLKLYVLCEDGWNYCETKISAQFQATYTANLPLTTSFALIEIVTDSEAPEENEEYKNIEI
jgi:hypothetical protein